MNDIFRSVGHPNTNTLRNILRQTKSTFIEKSVTTKKKKKLIRPNIWNSLLNSLEVTEIVNTYNPLKK